jgi:hypothetical protein
MLKHITTFPFTKHPCVSGCSQQTSILYTPLRASMAHIACSLVSYLRKAQPIRTYSKVSIIPWPYNSMPTLTRHLFSSDTRLKGQRFCVLRLHKLFMCFLARNVSTYWGCDTAVILQYSTNPDTDNLELKNLNH